MFSLLFYLGTALVLFPLTHADFFLGFGGGFFRLLLILLNLERLLRLGMWVIV